MEIFRKGNKEGTITIHPKYAEIAPSIEMVEEYGGLVMAKEVNSYAMDLFLSSKDLYDTAQHTLLYLKKYHHSDATSQKENIALQRKIVRSITNIK